MYRRLIPCSRLVSLSCVGHFPLTQFAAFSSKSSPSSASSSPAPTASNSASNAPITPDFPSLLSLFRSRGFLFPSSDLYGGLSGAYDYGPLGVALKRNLSSLWWKDFIVSRPDCVGLDSAIIQSPRVWESAGHVERFTDPIIQCSNCQHRARADKMIQEPVGVSVNDPAYLSLLESKLNLPQVKCPSCGKKGTFTSPVNVNLLCDTSYGTSKAYLRPETAQGIFIHFRSIVSSLRLKVPFGVGQIGKSFRNEISPGPGPFRMREFEQMELEYFYAPEQVESEKLYRYWIEFCYQWLLSLGIRSENLRLVEAESDSLAHYARRSTDIEYKFPFGWQELWGIADRGDYDLKTHSEKSGTSLAIQEDVEGEDGKLSQRSFVPWVIEPAIGLDRLVLAVLCDAFLPSEKDGFQRGKATDNILRLKKHIAPYRFAVLPLMKKPPLVEKAQWLFTELRRAGVNVSMDASGSIGRRYARQDEIGTPECIAIDYQSLEDGTITVRDRDTKQQIRIQAEKLIQDAKEQKLNE